MYMILSNSTSQHNTSLYRSCVTLFVISKSRRCKPEVHASNKNPEYADLIGSLKIKIVFPLSLGQNYGSIRIFSFDYTLFYIRTTSFWVRLNVLKYFEDLSLTRF